MDMYILLYFNWTTKKDLLYSTGNPAQYYVAAQMRREVWGRMDTCICLAESLYCPPETVTLLTGYTPRQNQKLYFFFLKKRPVLVSVVHGLSRPLPSGLDGMTVPESEGQTHRQYDKIILQCAKILKPEPPFISMKKNTQF